MGNRVRHISCCIFAGGYQLPINQQPKHIAQTLVPTFECSFNALYINTLADLHVVSAGGVHRRCQFYFSRQPQHVAIQCMPCLHDALLFFMPLFFWQLVNIMTLCGSVIVTHARAHHEPHKEHKSLSFLLRQVSTGPAPRISMSSPNTSYVRCPPSPDIQC